jgi:hypothetical protein
MVFLGGWAFLISEVFMYSMLLGIVPWQDLRTRPVLDFEPPLQKGDSPAVGPSRQCHTVGASPVRRETREPLSASPLSVLWPLAISNPKFHLLILNRSP